MNYNLFSESPFKTEISFHKLIESLEEIAVSDIDYRAIYAKSLLQEISHLPELKSGINDLTVIYENEELVKNLLSDLFPTLLTHNEIKAVTIPFQNLMFNYSERFKKILKNAGGAFDITIRDFDADQYYIMSCILILNVHYKQQFDITKPLFYDIPDENGITKHYRILYNADFIEILKTANAPELNNEDIEQLIDNYGDIDLWKSKFPHESWILKGFGIITLFDATTESAISNLKSNLLLKDDNQERSNPKFEKIFRSIFKLNDIRVGLIMYNEEEDKFIRPPYNNDDVKSFLLADHAEMTCSSAFMDCSIAHVVDQQKTLSISNVAHFAQIAGNEKLGEHLLKQNIRSCIFSPVIKNGKLLGIIEVVSTNAKSLNSINATNLQLVLPFVIDTIERYNVDVENQIEAVIQREYTAIHSSVYWKFKKEVEKYLKSSNKNKDYIFKEIVFKDVYPLYGQIDIKGSSEHRNETVKEDLKNQLNTLLNIIDRLNSINNVPLLEQLKFEMQSYFNELSLELKADTEQQIQAYIQKEIHPILGNEKIDEDNKVLIANYFSELDSKTALFYHSRKNFDDAMSIINKKMASILDHEQKEAQKIFPHYFERFKTDGVEHNLYIGASIAPMQTFDSMYLSNLRLWQLQTLCKMELEHHRLKAILPYELDVTSLILVFSSPISVRFRMDEKRFDVDGTYNARYEVVKKRIDKANIKGTTERITQKEKITIVYSNDYEEKEYLKYIKFLQFKNILEPTIEQFDVQELQGVSGLRALRIKVHNTDVPDKEYSYEDLLNEIS
ncbi:GAF domain-containing protein [Flavobacterium sp. 14A]|uniref:GAF domain-containing protein n=1 Tax=Flavobacterium sp. 14A TaxID=2735896 RepID=UPI00156DA113|nr:GAF domain-containing protein [Flavobacterium sp. 14A]NRT11889.1 hypothetical protein [Flavobacterium sp. 14A]